MSTTGGPAWQEISLSPWTFTDLVVAYWRQRDVHPLHQLMA